MPRAIVEILFKQPVVDCVEEIVVDLVHVVHVMNNARESTDVGTNIVAHIRWVICSVLAWGYVTS